MVLDDVAGAARQSTPVTAHEDARESTAVLPLYRQRSTEQILPALFPALHDVVYIRDRNGLQRVDRGRIRLVEADGNYVEIHTLDRRFVLRNSLREVMIQLGDDRFVQVNRHTAVNIERLVRVDCDSLEVDDQCITLSRNYRTNLLDRLQVLCGR